MESGGDECIWGVVLIGDQLCWIKSARRINDARIRRRQVVISLLKQGRTEKSMETV